MRNVCENTFFWEVRVLHVNQSPEISKEMKRKYKKRKFILYFL